MSRVSFGEAADYGNGEFKSTPFFGLKDDGDRAVVRFLIETPEDIQGCNVHEVLVDGKRRKVSCLREKGDGVEKCPLCSSNDLDIKKTRVKYYIHLVEYEGTYTLGKGWNFNGNRVVKIWERPGVFETELKGLMAEYNPFYNQLFEIKRVGKKGDTNTKYNIYPVQYPQNEFPLSEEDWEFTDVLGGIVADKSAEEMQHYLATGKFSETTNNQQTVGVTRRGTSTQSTQPTQVVSEPVQSTPVYQEQPQPVAQPQPAPSQPTATRAVGRRGAL